MTQISHHWEDFAPGWHYESPPRTLTSGDITSFAREYDPQTYHTDEEAAKASPFGGLIASGWQTCSVARWRWTARTSTSTSGAAPPKLCAPR